MRQPKGSGDQRGFTVQPQFGTPAWAGGHFEVVAGYVRTRPCRQPAKPAAERLGRSLFGGPASRQGLVARSRISAPSASDTFTGREDPPQEMFAPTLNGAAHSRYFNQINPVVEHWYPVAPLLFTHQRHIGHP